MKKKLRLPRFLNFNCRLSRELREAVTQNTQQNSHSVVLYFVVYRQREELTGTNLQNNLPALEETLNNFGRLYTFMIDTRDFDMHKITEVQVLGNYRLHLTFEDGT